MPTLPTNRTTSNTATEHVDDHNTLHGLNNQLGNFTQTTSAPASPVAGDLWLDTDEVAQSGTSGLVDFDHKTLTTGNKTLNSTAFADVDNTVDIVLTAATGDVVEVGASLRCGNEAITAIFDVATIVGGVPVNYFGAAGGADDGVEAWYCPSGTFEGHGGSVMRTLVSGDISSGTVTLRFRYRTATAGNKTFVSSAAQPFKWWAKNYGPIPA